jgi:hypothetical protein
MTMLYSPPDALASMVEVLASKPSIAVVSVVQLAAVSKATLAIIYISISLIAVSLVKV